MEDRIEVGDLANIKAVFTTVPARGTISRGAAILTLEDAADAAGYVFGDTVIVGGAGPGGADLVTTINAITGRVLTLAANADTAATNTDVGKATNPTSVSCTVVTPTGAQLAPGVFNDGVGQYHANYQTTEPGVHTYEFVGVGLAQGVVVGQFDVIDAGFQTLSPRALCTLGELKQFVGNMAADDDGNLVAAINAASQRIYRVAGREFVARNAVRSPSTGIVTVAAQARRFTIDRSLVDGRLLWAGDIAATTWTPSGTLTLSTYATQSGAPTALVVDDLTYQPVSREPWEPITRIAIPTTVGLVNGWQLEITAIWGFPQIPDDIREACKQLAFGSYLRDPRRRSRQLDDQGQDLPRTLIGAALRTAREYNNRPPVTSLATPAPAQPPYYLTAW